MSHFCHPEPVEACRDIKHLHSPFDGLRVTVVTFYEFSKDEERKQLGWDIKRSLPKINDIKISANYGII
jgi:hypothetical protein